MSIIGNAITLGGGGGNDALKYALSFYSSQRSKFYIQKELGKTWDGTLEYTTDGKTWSVWGGETVYSSDDGFIALRGSNNTHIQSQTANDPLRIIAAYSGFTCIGNIETLLDWVTVKRGQHPIMGDYCFRNLFKNINIFAAPSMPSPTLAKWCYSSMYEKTLLSFPPLLPATTMAEMCYYNMFAGSLVKRSVPLRATTLAKRCYHKMYYGCTQLETVAALPAITLADRCYESMYEGCSKLKLSATEVGYYSEPFRIPTTGTGVVGTDSLKNMFTSTGGTFTGTPSIDTTYYLENVPEK